MAASLAVLGVRAQASQIGAFVEAAGLENFSELVREEFYRQPRPEDRKALGLEPAR